MPSERIFRGAKGLCAFAAQVGYIDASRANTIAECKRQHIEANELRRLLQNPVLTEEERASHIHLYYQMAEKNDNRQLGAKPFLAYLQSQNKSLAEASTSDLGRWARMPIPKGDVKSNLPSGEAFDGAKGLCALAADVGYIDAQRAVDIATYTFSQPEGPSSSMVHPSEAGLAVVDSSSAMLERVNKRLSTDDQGASTSMYHSFAFPQSDALFREFVVSPPRLLDPNLHIHSPQAVNSQSLIDELESLEDVLGPSGQLSC